MSKPPELLIQIADHLKFFGYRCDITPEGLDAFHEIDPYFRIFLSSVSGGVIFVAPFEPEKAALEDKTGFLFFLNEVNSKGAAVSKFYFDDDMMWVEAWFPALYDKEHFGSFFRRVLHEVTMPYAVDADGVRKFLRPPPSP